MLLCFGELKLKAKEGNKGELSVTFRQLLADG